MELGYKDSELKKMEQSVMQYCYNQELIRIMQEDFRFLQVLNSWITGDPEKYKKEVLVEALEKIGFQELAEITNRQYQGESSLQHAFELQS
jgi:predicted small secreted protein